MPLTRCQLAGSLIPWSPYANDQANCSAVTTIVFVLGLVFSMSARNDAAGDRRAGHEDRGDRCPNHLEAGVAVNRLAIGLITKRRRNRSTLTVRMLITSANTKTDATARAFIEGVCRRGLVRGMLR